MTALLPGPIPLDRLRLDVLLQPRDRLELPTREHLGLVAEIRRVGPRALTVRKHRERTRLSAELHGENPTVAADRLTLAVRIVAVLENSKASDVPRTAADRHVDCSSSQAVHVAPCDIVAA